MVVGQTYQVKCELEGLEDVILTWKVNDETVTKLDSKELTIMFTEEKGAEV